MRPIPGIRLWLGNAQDARDFRPLLDLEIEAVIDLAMAERPEPPPRELIWIRIPLLDGAGNPPARLRLAVNAVAQMISSETPALVACSAGMSRSPAIVAAALATLKNEPGDEWLVRVAGGGPHDIAPLLWRDVKQACGLG